MIVLKFIGMYFSLKRFTSEQLIALHFLHILVIRFMPTSCCNFRLSKARVFSLSCRATMGKKCCVYGCKTNYKSKKSSSDVPKVPVFRFPTEEVEKEAWILAIPNDQLRVSKESVVCEVHWPAGYETITKNGKLRPKFPPSVWPNVPASQVPTPAPPRRQTRRSTCSNWNVQPDQLQDFQKLDKLTFSELTQKLLSGDHDLKVDVIAFMDADVLHVQSRKLVNGTPLFISRISPDQSFENFHLGKIHMNLFHFKKSCISV